MYAGYVRNTEELKNYIAAHRLVIIVIIIDPLASTRVEYK
jgi:hypothetical protein